MLFLPALLSLILGTFDVAVPISQSGYVVTGDIVRGIGLFM